MKERIEPIFTQKQLQELLSTDSVSKREELTGKLEDRIDYIVRECFFKLNKTNGWWSWEYYENDSNLPSFSKSLVNQESNILKVYIDCGCDSGYLYNGEKWGFFEGGIPLDTLWTLNVKSVFENGKKELKIKEDQEKAKKKKRRETIEDLKVQYRSSAMGKLTPEEKWACGLSKKIPKLLKV